MDVDWKPLNHSIADVLEWDKNERLELQPEFQRKQVWSRSAKIMLIDTILQHIPMPKFFIQSIIKGDKCHRIVIDGQQRLTAILEYLRDEYPLEMPYEGEYVGKRFSELPQEIQHKILEYTIDANEIRNADKKTIRAIYSRVNKYTVQLNKQELRRADFPGQFLKLSESLAHNKFLEENGVFTIANSRRMGDVEFVSELLAMLLDGPQEKKESLDSFYLNYGTWDKDDRESIKERFESVIADLAMIWQVGDELGKLKPFPKTRFHQKADFYALFNAIDDLHKEGFSLNGKELKALRGDLAILDEFIAPQSQIQLFQKYAIQCVSQSNTIGSRIWRRNVLRAFLDGTYKQVQACVPVIREFHNILMEAAHSGLIDMSCPICERRHSESADLRSNCVTLGWAVDVGCYHLSNACLIHNECVAAAREKHYSVGFEYCTGDCDDDVFCSKE
ncbi:MAG: DUF262 domain-containing protein [Bacteroidales bacterium]|nr:DUF262 domain-containing protein [Bacteroidales bacterium]